MVFTQDDKQKIGMLLQLASLGVTANTGDRVQSYTCPCGNTCAGECTEKCAPGCTGFLTFG